MKKLTCMNCGYVFDEEKGVPGKRMPPNRNAMLKTGCGWHKNPDNALPAIEVAPGTKWEDLPDDWACPLCGATKGEFKEQTADAKPTLKHSDQARSL